jgi:cob(I)alamin adenosyltransferase
MVKLDKIYTRGGDAGETSLGDGTRMPKHRPRIVAQGEIDEANAALGLASADAPAGELRDILARVQNDMFDLGADICLPGTDPGDGRLRIQPAQVAALERIIDRLSERLQPLSSFVLRGGSALAARLHFACTVVRRAERAAVALHADTAINPQALAYLNRLSDLLFVMARIANDDGRADVLWRPGAGADGRD